MKIAAWQAPLLIGGSMAALDLIRQQIVRCEADGVEILCCPEAVLGGLADDLDDPSAIAIESRELECVLASLASQTVTAIVGFTERSSAGALYNAAAVLHRGAVVGIYRKHHPAVRRSVYTPDDRTPVFAIGGLTFGVVICRDSTFAEPARTLARLGATVLFVPTNNALRPSRTGRGIVDEARATDIARAVENRVTIVRADVAGEMPQRIAYGTSGITGPDGRVRAEAPLLTPALLVATIATSGLTSARGSPTPPRPAAPPAG